MKNSTVVAGGGAIDVWIHQFLSDNYYVNINVIEP